MGSGQSCTFLHPMANENVSSSIHFVKLFQSHRILIESLGQCRRLEQTSVSSLRFIACGDLFHAWATLLGCATFCGRNRRVVSMARMRTMAAHGMPEYPFTVQPMLSTMKQRSWATHVFVQRRESHGGVFDFTSLRASLCGAHTLYSQSLMM